MLVVALEAQRTFAALSRTIVHTVNAEIEFEEVSDWVNSYRLQA